MDRPDKVLGFKVVVLKFSKESKTGHQLLWKQHSVRTHSDAKPVNRTLFVVNVPPYCDKRALTHLFSQYGKVRQVHLHKRPTSAPAMRPRYPHFSRPTPVLGFKAAYVVFTQTSALKKVLALPAGTELTLSTEERPVLTGIRKWQRQYNAGFVKRDRLAEEVKKVMRDYDAKKERERTAGQQEPDSEGWVTVISDKKKKPHLEKVDEVKKKKGSKKKKQQQLVNFYSFQQRQAKMNHLAELRKKFEEDKKRIAQMRNSRKFRPY
ncbi:ribosomal RNA-processing protein 7 homolog A-like isoform X1 [Scylla paramamosain]|uniref:ribosomal RNA-processing protein 7 homolog A-like isoform X1 n=1 Tax=Scylla paramamosain TaxID=85552 RepID=UPI00308318D0